MLFAAIMVHVVGTGPPLLIPFQLLWSSFPPPLLLVLAVVLLFFSLPSPPPLPSSRLFDLCFCSSAAAAAGSRGVDRMYVCAEARFHAPRREEPTLHRISLHPRLYPHQSFTLTGTDPGVG